MTSAKPGLFARLWLVCHPPAAMLLFQLALDWIDPAQTDKWLELPVLALVGLAAGLLLDARLPRLLAGWLACPNKGRFTFRIALSSVLALWLLLSAAWALVYLVEFLLGFGIQDTIRMLALMPLVLGFYLPLLLIIGSLAGLVSARVLRPLLLTGREA